jgi:hypothetical protein
MTSQDLEITSPENRLSKKYPAKVMGKKMKMNS